MCGGFGDWAACDIKLSASQGRPRPKELDNFTNPNTWQYICTCVCHQYLWNLASLI